MIIICLFLRLWFLVPFKHWSQSIYQQHLYIISNFSKFFNSNFCQQNMPRWVFSEQDLSQHRQAAWKQATLLVQHAAAALKQRRPRSSRSTMRSRCPDFTPSRSPFCARCKRCRQSDFHGDPSFPTFFHAAERDGARPGCGDVLRIFFKILVIWANFGDLVILISTSKFWKKFVTLVTSYWGKFFKIQTFEFWWNHKVMINHRGGILIFGQILSKLKILDFRVKDLKFCDFVKFLILGLRISNFRDITNFVNFGKISSNL